MHHVYTSTSVSLSRSDYQLDCALSGFCGSKRNSLCQVTPDIPYILLSRDSSVQATQHFHSLNVWTPAMCQTLRPAPGMPVTPVNRAPVLRKLISGAGGNTRVKKSTVQVAKCCRRCEKAPGEKLVGARESPSEVTSAL